MARLLERSFDGTKIAVALIILVAVGFLFASRFTSPAPPDRIVIAAGRPGGAYTLFAEQYREALARHAIDVEILHTKGTLENFALLHEGRADLALVQAGMGGIEPDSGFVSLGSVFYEPLWIFARPGLRLEQISELRGARLDIGAEGSGSRALAKQVLAANSIGEQDATWLIVPPAERRLALEEGAIDVSFEVGSIDSPLIRNLVLNPKIQLVSLARAEAYTRLDRGLTRLVLPEGVINLPRNVPSSDVVLLASVGELVVGPDFHPALVDVMLQAASEVHKAGDIFAKPGEFPSRYKVDLPLDPDADRYFEYGPPFLQRYLPFWAAAQIDRLKVMLIPLLALLVPLVRIFPPTYRWRVRSRIYRWYGELREADPGIAKDLSPEQVHERLATIEGIEREATKIPTPESYAEELYALRLHIDFVRRRLLESGPKGVG